MDLGIGGRRALLVGGTSGIGLATAEVLAQEGARLALFSRSVEKLEAAAGQLRTGFGAEVVCIPGNMTVPADVARLAETLRATGGYDILVLNSARPPSPMREFLEETDDARWDEAYETQLRGVLAVLRAVAPILAERGWGRIVAITSASVKQPMAYHALSTVFRAGVTAALKHLANELAPKGVTVNAVCPASVLTPNFAAHNDAEARRRTVPMQRLGKPAEVAATIAFLASEQAGFITGASVQVDGGMVAALI
jgi:3-oxoacyl-[acyl-carrier protein] reductase